MNDILLFIQRIRDSEPGSVVKYTEGGCYDFYKILLSEYPQSLPYYDSDHVITKIDDNYYDITGKAEKKNHILMTIDQGWIDYYESKSILTDRRI